MEMQKKNIYIYIQLKNIYTVYVIRHVKKVVIYIWWLDDFNNVEILHVQYKNMTSNEMVYF